MVKKFKSRYGDERILTLLEDGRYRVEGRTLYTRHGDGLFDFEGGPCYIVGDRLLDVQDHLIIEKIEIDESVFADNYASVILTVRKQKVTNAKAKKKNSSASA
jgi:hypothetical protein